MKYNKNEVKKAKQIIKNTIGKDCNFIIDDLILFVGKRYNAKIFNSMQDYNDNYNLGHIDNIEDVIDVLAWDMVKKPYKVIDAKDDYIIINYNNNNEITDYFYACGRCEIEAMFIRLFLKNGELKILNEIERYKKNCNKKFDVSILG